MNPYKAIIKEIYVNNILTNLWLVVYLRYQYRGSIL